MLEPGASHSRPPAVEALRELADTHLLRFKVRAVGTLELETVSHDGLTDGLFELLLIIHIAQQGRELASSEGLCQPGLPMGVLRSLPQPAWQLV